MRALTEAEARTIAVLLGSASAPERERLTRSGLPRSTYHAARRRAYSEGWLRDRYVPEPERFGLPWAAVLLARPFADHREELARRWREEPSNVLLLTSPGVVVGVFFLETEAEARALAAGDRWRGLAGSTSPVVASLHGPGVPVYFDFEGLWAHLSGTSGTVAYPRGIGGSSAPEGAGPGFTAHQRWAASELAFRPFADPGVGSGGKLVGPLGLPFSQKRLVAAGWVQHRVFLDPSKLSSFRGNAADLYVFVSGALRPGTRPEVLFQTLVRECRVFPFLFVVGEDRLLLGAMGDSRGRAPGDAAGNAGRRPVMPTLQAAIAGIEILQEPANAFTVPVDHRYDRLLPRRSVG